MSRHTSPGIMSSTPRGFRGTPLPSLGGNSYVGRAPAQSPCHLFTEEFLAGWAVDYPSEYTPTTSTVRTLFHGSIEDRYRARFHSGDRIPRPIPVTNFISPERVHSFLFGSPIPSADRRYTFPNTHASVGHDDLIDYRSSHRASSVPHNPGFQGPPTFRDLTPAHGRIASLGSISETSEFTSISRLPSASRSNSPLFPSPRINGRHDPFPSPPSSRRPSLQSPAALVSGSHDHFPTGPYDHGDFFPSPSGSRRGSGVRGTIDSRSGSVAGLQEEREWESFDPYEYGDELENYMKPTPREREEIREFFGL